MHTILRVAHSVAQITPKAAQNSPFRCSTMYRKLLICIRSGYYLANFKTAGFNRSPTPPFLIIACNPWALRTCAQHSRTQYLPRLRCVFHRAIASAKQKKPHLAVRWGLGVQTSSVTPSAEVLSCAAPSKWQPKRACQRSAAEPSSAQERWSSQTGQ